MKKYMVITSIWILLLAIPTIANSNDQVKYIIYMDSEIGNVYDCKIEVQEIFNKLVDSVDEKSYNNIIIDNLKKFKTIKGSTVMFKENTLIVAIGDGNGTFISGTLQKDAYCIPEVKPKSFIMEIFNFFK